MGSKQRTFTSRWAPRVKFSALSFLLVLQSINVTNSVPEKVEQAKERTAPGLIFLRGLDTFCSFVLYQQNPGCSSSKFQRSQSGKMAETVEETTLEATPTWAVATVCFILISISIILEHLLHLLSNYFTRKRRKSVIQALDKIKSELMLLGFISLLLTVSEKAIANICVPKGAAESFLPCGGSLSIDESEEEEKCAEQGKVSFLSRTGVRELQYLIFVLASFHSFSCFLIFGLGMAKMRRWESWEAETSTLEYQFSRDPRRFQLTHQTSFGRRHLSTWNEHRLLRCLTCFLRQFYGSVSKVDYLTLRHGFIMAHFDHGSNFNFQKYIRRALDKDFKKVAGISFWIWIFAVCFIFFSAHRFYSHYWLPIIPLVMLLVVGAKLQGIITSMCLDSHGRSHVVRGTLLVKPSDHYFWFQSPKLLLQLIRFILFQNNFQLAFFTWTGFKFGLRSCFHREIQDIVIRLAMGLLVHFLCGYVTLPLYALVTQMGTTMKKAVFTGNVVVGLKRWRARARKNLKSNYSARPSLDASLTTSLSLDSSPSFGIDASYSLDFGLPTLDGDVDHVSIEVVKDEDNGGPRQPQEHQKKGSFEGFNNATSDISNSVLEKQSSPYG